MPQTRLGDRSLVPCDTHGRICCPHCCIGPAITGSPNVFVNLRPAVRVTDQGVHALCCGPNTWVAVLGSTTVLINNLQAHRLFDLDAHCGGPGYMVDGSPNVLVGDLSVGSAAPSVGALKLKAFPAEAPVPPGAAPGESKPPTPSPDQGPKQAPPGSTSDWEQQLRQCAPTPILIREEVAPKLAFQQEARQPPPEARDTVGQGVEAERKGFWSRLRGFFSGGGNLLLGFGEGLLEGLGELLSALTSPITWLIIAAVAGLVFAGVVSLATVAIVGAVLMGIGVVVGLIAAFKPGLSLRERGRLFGKVSLDLVLTAAGVGIAKLAKILKGFKLFARLGSAGKGIATAVKAKVVGMIRSVGKWAKGFRDGLARKASAGWEKVKGVFRSRNGKAKPPRYSNQTHPSGPADASAVPKGRRTRINLNDDAETQRSLLRENESADILSQKGYKVEQNPRVPGTRNPDYLIEGKVFDCYSPTKNKSPRGIWSYIEDEKLKKGQTTRVLLNLQDWGGDLAKLKKQFLDWPMKGLDEVMVLMKDKSIFTLVP